MKKTLLIVAGIGIVLIIVAGGVLWLNRRDLQRSLEQASLPSAEPYHAPSSTPVESTQGKPSFTPSSTPAPLPPEANLAVPFTPQAPTANWDAEHEEFCEEASTLMAISYVHNQTIPSPAYAEAQLQALKTFEEKRFGYYKDTTVQEMATVFREYYHYDHVSIMDNPTVTGLKQAIAAGKLVLVPAAGQLLGNPNFQAPGPLYHMLVIKGYTKDGQFITNDPGTRRGADYLYKEDVLMNALHNWRSDGNIEQGPKQVLVVG